MLVEHKHIKIPWHIEELHPYVPGKTLAEVRAAYHPARISKLASNENRLGCSPKVTEAIAKSLAVVQDYPDSASRDLCRLLARKLGVKDTQIIAGAGSESLIGALARTFLQQRDHAITADVTFLGFRIQTQIRGVERDLIPLTKDYRFDLPAIADAVNDQTRMIYIANPNNPTGTYVTKTEFEVFMSRIPEDVIVVVDEAYFEFAEDEPDYPNTIGMGYDNVVTLRTFSKAYGLAGLRVGYAVGPEELIRDMYKVKFTFEPSVTAQVAAEAALSDQDFIEKTREMVGTGKERLYHFCDSNGLRYVPSYANAVMLVFKSETEANHFTQEMLKRGVILRQLNGFGMPNGVRITIGTDREMKHFEDSYKDIYL
ncbi:MAG TPA: histidinol-phosphate transaminase [Balneolales bacterium]|nr:histidinol-phosphate transaminase [Balneolales bacterium]